MPASMHTEHVSFFDTAGPEAHLRYKQFHFIYSFYGDLIIFNQMNQSHISYHNFNKHFALFEHKKNCADQKLT